MKFIHRLGYYLGGFSIGLVILAFFLSGKKTTCSYSPNARVLKNIRIKERNYSEAALKDLSQHQLDTSHISNLLISGDVEFDRSNTDLDSCKIYMVTGEADEKLLELLVQNCDSIATVMEIMVKKKQ